MELELEKTCVAGKDMHRSPLSVHPLVLGARQPPLGVPVKVGLRTRHQQHVLHGFFFPFESGRF
jgi:hypothetical protein